MSIFNYIFDNEWSQRSDIETLKQQNASLASRVARRRSSEAVQEERVAELEREVGELALLGKTLLRVLLEKGVSTGREIEDMMHHVDLEDGVADGRVTKNAGTDPGKCPECNRPIQAERKRCLYCGHQSNVLGIGQ